MVSVLCGLIPEAVVVQGLFCFQVGGWRLDGTWLFQNLFGLGILNVRLSWDLLFQGGFVDGLFDYLYLFEGLLGYR